MSRQDEEQIERQVDDILEGKDPMFRATLPFAGGDGSFLGLIRIKGREVTGYAYSRPNPEMVRIAQQIAGPGGVYLIIRYQSGEGHSTYYEPTVAMARRHLYNLAYIELDVDDIDPEGVRLGNNHPPDVTIDAWMREHGLHYVVVEENELLNVKDMAYAT